MASGPYNEKGYASVLVVDDLAGGRLAHSATARLLLPVARLFSLCDASHCGMVEARKSACVVFSEDLEEKINGSAALSDNVKCAMFSNEVSCLYVHEKFFSSV